MIVGRLIAPFLGRTALIAALAAGTGAVLGWKAYGLLVAEKERARLEKEVAEVRRELERARKAGDRYRARIEAQRRGYDALNRRFQRWRAGSGDRPCLDDDGLRIVADAVRAANRAAGTDGPVR